MVRLVAKEGVRPAAFQMLQNGRRPFFILFFYFCICSRRANCHAGWPHVLLLFFFHSFCIPSFVGLFSPFVGRLCGQRCSHHEACQLCTPYPYNLSIDLSIECCPFRVRILFSSALYFRDIRGVEREMRSDKVGSGAVTQSRGSRSLARWFGMEMGILTREEADQGH